MKRIRFLFCLMVCMVCMSFPALASDYFYEGFPYYVVFKKGDLYGFSVGSLPYSMVNINHKQISCLMGASTNSILYSSLDECISSLYSVSDNRLWIASSGFMFFDVPSYGSLIYSNFDIVVNGTDEVYFSANIGGDVPTNSFKYDSTIPAPTGLKFTSVSSGGFLGINANYKHNLSWTNTFTEDLQARISVQYKYTTSDGIPQYADFTLSSAFPSKNGFWFQNVDDIKKAIMKDSYSSLNALNQYRVQFYKVVDGVEHVGPVGVVHLNKSFTGNYTGSTVTTEYPKDLENVGDGMDSQGDSWTSDGQDYNDYDSDGNLVGSGSSNGGLEGTGDLLSSFIRSLANIPQILTSFFSSLQNMLSGIGQFPVLLGQLFSFLPQELMLIITSGLTVVVVLRIFGR